MNPQPGTPRGPDAEARPGQDAIEALLRADGAAMRDLPDDGFTERVMTALAIETSRPNWSAALPQMLVVFAVMAVLLAGLPAPGPAMNPLPASTFNALARLGAVPWPVLAAAGGVALAVLLALDLPWVAGSDGPV